MKVKELIDILNKYPENREVKVYVDDGGYLDSNFSVFKGRVNINDEDDFYFEDDYDEIEEIDISNYNDIVIIY